MNQIDRSVSLHPYFKIHARKADEVKSLLREFVTRTTSEEKVLYYEFTLSEDIVFCREAYTDAEGALAHLANVRDLLNRMLTLCDIVRLEIHGPSTELDKLKGPVGNLNPVWFTYECGIRA